MITIPIPTITINNRWLDYGRLTSLTLCKLTAQQRDFIKQRLHRIINDCTRRISRIDHAITVVISTISTDFFSTRVECGIVVVTVNVTTFAAFDAVTIAVLIRARYRTVNGSWVNRIDQAITVVVDPVSAIFLSTWINVCVAVVTIDFTTGTTFDAITITVVVCTCVNWWRWRCNRGAEKSKLRRCVSSGRRLASSATAITIVVTGCAIARKWGGDNHWTTLRCA